MYSIGVNIRLGTKVYEKLCVISYKHNIILFGKCNSVVYRISQHCWMTVTEHMHKPRLLVGEGHEHFFAECACHVWGEMQFRAHATFAILHVSLILFTWDHEVGIKYSRHITLFMLQIFCTQSLPVLLNDQKILHNIAPMSSAWLIPMCDILSTENSYICKYLASEDILDSNMTG